MKGPLLFLAAGLVLSGFAYAPALLPQEDVVDEKIRLEPGKDNYATGTGEGGFAIGLPRMSQGDHVNITWDLRTEYAVRILPDGDGPTAPGLADVEPLHDVPPSRSGELNFTAPGDASYWLTLTVDGDDTLERGNVLLTWDPPLEPTSSSFYGDLAWGLLRVTLVLTAVFIAMGWWRARQAAKQA